jgi:IstB-like ATP binding protein
MSLQSERLLAHMQRLRLSHLPACYESLAETAAAKNLPYLDFLEQLLDAESSAKHARNVRLKTQWAHFPYNKGLEQFDFSFQPSIDERKLRELAALAFLERKENILLLGPPRRGQDAPGDRAGHRGDHRRLLGVLRECAGAGGAVSAGARREQAEGAHGPIGETQTADPG